MQNLFSDSAEIQMEIIMRDISAAQKYWTITYEVCLKKTEHLPKIIFRRFETRQNKISSEANVVSRWAWVVESGNIAGRSSCY